MYYIVHVADLVIAKDDAGFYLVGQVDPIRLLDVLASKATGGRIEKWCDRDKLHDDVDGSAFRALRESAKEELLRHGFKPAKMVVEPGLVGVFI